MHGQLRILQILGEESGIETQEGASRQGSIFYFHFNQIFFKIRYGEPLGAPGLEPYLNRKLLSRKLCVCKQTMLLHIDI